MNAVRERLKEICWRIIAARERRHDSPDGWPAYELALAELQAALSPEIVMDLLLSAQRHDAWFALVHSFERRSGGLRDAIAIGREAVERLAFNRRKALMQQSDLIAQVQRLTKERDEAREQVTALRRERGEA